MLAYLFPGQGSQHRGMGRALFDTIQPYVSVEREIDRVLGFSVRDVCLNGPDARLIDTRYTQPCLFVVNALHCYDALAKQQPAALAGHSLGEYNALLAAGVFDLLTGVRLVARRGALMAEANGGAMTAVLRLPSDEVVRLLERPDLAGIDVANYNTPQQTVIAGPADRIARAAAAIDRAGGACVPLQVSTAFHSRYMAHAADRFAQFLESFSFDAPQLPVISNVTGDFYPTIRPTETIRSLLAQQITKPVRWVYGIRRLRAAGVTAFSEIGPGTVLTRLGQQIDQQSAALGV